MRIDLLSKKTACIVICMSNQNLPEESRSQRAGQFILWINHRGFPGRGSVKEVVRIY
jgi:hypothetical protein